MLAYNETQLNRNILEPLQIVELEPDYLDKIADDTDDDCVEDQ